MASAGGTRRLEPSLPSGSSETSSTAVYTAPAVPPSPAIRYRNGYEHRRRFQIRLGERHRYLAGLQMTIAPAAFPLWLGQTQTFTASLCVASGTPIAWDVNGAVNGNAL